MRIASWNVNSAKARQAHILNYLRANSCDVLLIQETKTQDVNFPVKAYQELGWHVAFHGQKSYNGVAIISRLPLSDGTHMDWAGRARAGEMLTSEMPVVLGGDFNVIPQDIDCHDPPGWEGDALTRPESRAAFYSLCHDGYTDALRACHPAEVLYSYWDYQAGAWQKDNGVRIDHLLLSPEAADRITGAGVDKGPRGEEKPSDHTPVWVELADAA